MANTIGWGQAAVNNTIDWGKGKTNNAIGWGSVYSVSPYGETDISGTPAGDTDANAFIAAAAITDTTQKAAIDKLVVDLKGYGIWSKMKAIYPFIGGTAAQHKYNLRSPLDTDAAFRLTFFGGITHSANGITGNATNAYANTFLNENSVLTLNNEHISLYVRNNVTTSNVVQMGTFTTKASRFVLNTFNTINYSTLGQGQTQHPLNYPVKGFVALSKTVSTNCKYYQNTDTPVIKNESGPGKNNSNFFILAQSNTTVAQQFCSDNISFVTIGDGLTDTDVSNLRLANLAFQTTLSRNV